MKSQRSTPSRPSRVKTLLSPSRWPSALRRLPVNQGSSAAIRCKVYLWSDTDGDGDPSNGGFALLNTIITTVSAGSIDTDIFQNVVISPTLVPATGFFIGYAVTHAPVTFPLPVDQSQLSLGRAWVAGDTTGNWDPILMAGDVLPVPADLDTIGFSCVWLLRATGTPDLCEDAIGPLAVPSVVSGTTNNTTFDDVGVCGTSNTAPGVWYTVIGTGNTMTATTCENQSFPGSADYDTKITVFRSDPLSNCCVFSGVGGPGCDDPVCEAAVCAIDPFCCETQWDGLCANQAAVLCPDLCVTLCGLYLTCVDGNDNESSCNLHSTVMWSSQVGVEYRILVHGFGSATGNFGLAVSDAVSVGVGACCVPSGGCTAGVTQADCENALAGTYLGDDTVCLVSFSHQETLTALDGAASDALGNAVAIAGDSAIVGAHFDDDAGGASGSAYVFVRDGVSWTQQDKLTANDAAAGDVFGIAVAISGDTVVVGASDDDDAGSNSGSAYVFVRNGMSWPQQAKLTASDAAALDAFGRDVAISGNLIIIGAPNNDDNGSESGSAYIYRFDPNTSEWFEEAKLLASDGMAFDAFGISCAIGADVAIVGAYGDGHDEGVQFTGSAYIFRFDGSTWIQEAKLVASDAAAGDEFGWSVAMSGDVVIIGVYSDDDNGDRSGSAYIYRFDGLAWLEEAKLLAS
ncbi:MAG: FG-GAP repeat protein, partial [Planctomycetes bacterium]|nr:FG-GAP repeat protein [Planctomycetota bacterium]